MYIPKPINTNDIILTDELMELKELLAKNTHEVWAKGRAEEGWTYGDKRDDFEKKTPCMVPYELLNDDDEKEYDRKTALETLKLIVKLGYTISKASGC